MLLATAAPGAADSSYCVIHEFLVASMFRELVTYFMRRQGLIKSSDGMRVLDQLGALRDPLVSAVLHALPKVAPRCGLMPFDAAEVDMRLVSRGNGSPASAREELADLALGFVLFVHREPRPFEGGTLDLYSSACESVIEPSQNSVVFFRSPIALRVGAVRAASGAFVDSRLTLEGWVRAPAAQNRRN